MSWQLPQEPPQPEKRRGSSGIDPDVANCLEVPACCLLESLAYCCWWPLLALGGLAAVVLWLG